MSEFEYIIKGLIAVIKEYIDNSKESKNGYDKSITLDSCCTFSYYSLDFVSVTQLYKKDNSYFVRINRCHNNMKNILGTTAFSLNALLTTDDIPLLIRIVRTLRNMEEIKDDRSE